MDIYLAPIDYIIIVGYMLGILLFGILFSRYHSSTKEFFLAGQRFPWYMISFSAVASLVGSYSFIKYSEAAYKFGLSATTGYMDDWWWVPIWMFGWIPFIYYSRVTSIPEYFHLRFDTKTRTAATVILLLYMIGYIGMNLFTLGVALRALLGWPVIVGATFAAVIVTIYVSLGGQTSVIMTDMLQGLMLLFAGFLVCLLGLSYVGGLGEFWHWLPFSHKFGLAKFNHPPQFNSVGIFWQDGITNTAAFWFMNQGIMMRFMSAKSVKEARKGMFFTVLILMPIAALVVAGPGLIGKVMVAQGVLPSDTSPKDIFIAVTNIITSPGFFGIIIAAIVAALMSTADTLINAVSAVFVNDIYKPYLKRGATDRHYVRIAQVASLGTAGIGLMLVPVFASFSTIYEAHAAFTASIAPPMVLAIVLGALWKRYTPDAGFWTLVGGFSLIMFSIFVPQVIIPFAHGTEMIPGPKAFSYMRALYGLICAGTIAVIVTMFTKPKPLDKLIGLCWGTEAKAAKTFKKELEL